MALDMVELIRCGKMSVSQMYFLRIADLAALMGFFGCSAEDSQVRSVSTSIRGKSGEELLTEERCYRPLELNHFFVTLPAFRDYKALLDFGASRILLMRKCLRSGFCCCDSLRAVLLLIKTYSCRI